MYSVYFKQCDILHKSWVRYESEIQRKKSRENISKDNFHMNTQSNTILLSFDNPSFF